MEAFIKPIILFLIGGYILFSSWNWNRSVTKGLRTTGMVVDIIERISKRSGGKRKKYFYPVVEFTVSHQTVRFEDEIGSRSRTYHKGQSVEVVYDPENPRKATVVSREKFCLYRIVLPVLGGILFFMGLSTLWSTLSAR